MSGRLLLFNPLWVTARETREGWLLLSVETEANGDSSSTYERGPSLAVSLGLSCRYKRFCPALSALVGPVQNIFSSQYTNSLYFSPAPSQLGRQSCRVARLLIGVSGLCIHMMQIEMLGTMHDKVGGGGIGGREGRGGQPVINDESNLLKNFINNRQNTF